MILNGGHMLMGPVLNLATRSIDGETDGAHGGMKVTFHTTGEFIFAVAATYYYQAQQVRGSIARPYVSEKSSGIEIIGNHVTVTTAEAYAVFRTSTSIIPGYNALCFVYSTLGLSSSDYTVEFLS